MADSQKTHDMYAVTVTLSISETASDGTVTVTTKQLPTFYLDPSTNGILNQEHAESIARQITANAPDTETRKTTAAVVVVPVGTPPDVVLVPGSPAEFAAARSKIVNGVFYHKETPDVVVEILEKARKEKARIHIHFGHTKASHANPNSPGVYVDWLEESDVAGYVSSSGGQQKVPLLIRNPTASGGCVILDHCIIRIRDKAGNDLYRHPEYSHGKVTLCDVDETRDMVRYRASVRVNGTVHANFGSRARAKEWLRFMGLTYTEE